LEKMLRLMVESDPRVLVTLKKGDVRRRKIRVDKSADRYTYDPMNDIPFPKQWRSALRAKVVGHRPLFGSWTDERLARSVDCATLTFVAVARNHADWATGHFGAQ
jgi:hypothetical protein